MANRCLQLSLAVAFIGYLRPLGFREMSFFCSNFELASSSSFSDVLASSSSFSDVLDIQFGFGFLTYPIVKVYLNSPQPLD